MNAQNYNKYLIFLENWFSVKHIDILNILSTCTNNSELIFKTISGFTTCQLPLTVSSIYLTV